MALSLASDGARPASRGRSLSAESLMRAFADIVKVILVLVSQTVKDLLLVGFIVESFNLQVYVNLNKK